MDIVLVLPIKSMDIIIMTLFYFQIINTDKTDQMWIKNTTYNIQAPPIRSQIFYAIFMTYYLLTHQI